MLDVVERDGVRLRADRHDRTVAAQCDLVTDRAGHTPDRDRVRVGRVGFDEKVGAQVHIPDVEVIAGLAFLESGADALLHGGQGAILSQLANAVGNSLLDAGLSPLLVDSGILGGVLAAKQDRSRLMDELRRLDRFDLIILTDIDRLVPGTREADLVGTLLGHRRRSRSVLATLGSGILPDVAPRSASAASRPLRRFVEEAQAVCLDS